jgi:hypothetical protein
MRFALPRLQYSGKVRDESLEAGWSARKIRDIRSMTPSMAEIVCRL